MKTIRQIADEIGVSKQAVFKKIKRDPLSTSLQGLTETVDGRLMVSVGGERLIKQVFSENSPPTAANQLTGAVDGLVDAPSTAVDGIVSVLQATIGTLQGQLEVKDRQIEQQAQTITRLTDALTAAQQTAATAQALHAGTIQKQLLTGEAGVDQRTQETEQRQGGWLSKLFRW